MSRFFDGTFSPANVEYIASGNNSPINNLPAFTTAAWVYWNGVNDGVILVKDPLNTYSNFMGLNAPNPPSMVGTIIQSDVAASSSYAFSYTTTGLPVNAWSWVVMTFDLNTDALIRLYVNNTELSYTQQTPASGTLLDDSGGGYYIGGDDGDGDTWSGNIAEVAVWDRVLSGPELAAAFASKTGVSGIASSDLVGYWHLCGTMSPEPDASGNGNTGVLSAPPPTQGPNSPGFTCPGSGAGGRRGQVIMGPHFGTHISR